MNLPRSSEQDRVGASYDDDYIPITSLILSVYIPLLSSSQHTTQYRPLYALQSSYDDAPSGKVNAFAANFAAKHSPVLKYFDRCLASITAAKIFRPTHAAIDEIFTNHLPAIKFFNLCLVNFEPPIFCRPTSIDFFNFAVNRSPAINFFNAAKSSPPKKSLIELTARGHRFSFSAWVSC